MIEGQPKIYQKVGFYLVKERIGVGAFSEVFVGYDTRNLKKVAIKVMSVAEINTNLEMKRGIENQVKALNLLKNSSHVVRFLEKFKTKRSKFLVYELCSEGTLQQLIKRNVSLTEEQAKAYLRQIILGYKQLFQNNIVHRDLKPENILLKKGKLKIADFGLCHVLSCPTDTMTAMVGTLRYQAPEIIQGASYTSKCDVYSLGVIFYRMLFGKCPFQMDCHIEMLLELNNRQLVFPAEFSVSQQTKLQITRMLEINEANRPDWPQLFSYFLNQSQLPLPHTLPFPLPQLLLNPNPPKSHLSTQATSTTQTTQTTLTQPKSCLQIDTILLLHEQILNVTDVLRSCVRYFSEGEFREVLRVGLGRIRRELDSLMREICYSMDFQEIGLDLGRTLEVLDQIGGMYLTWDEKEEDGRVSYYSSQVYQPYLEQPAHSLNRSHGNRRILDRHIKKALHPAETSLQQFQQQLTPTQITKLLMIIIHYFTTTTIHPFSHLAHSNFFLSYCYPIPFYYKKLHQQLHINLPYIYKI